MRGWHLPLVAGLAGILLLALTSQGHAAIQITVGDLELYPGENGFVDVMIRSDTGTDLLDMFGLEFRITTGGSTRLEFVGPPSDPQLTDPGYVLFADSLAELAPPAGNVSTVSQLNDTYIGGDGTLFGTGVAVPTTDTLLASLEVTAATGNAPQVGDTFTVSLEPGLCTFFWDPFWMDIDFSSTSGSVSVIPEPGRVVAAFFLAIALGMIIQSTRRFWRRTA